MAAQLSFGAEDLTRFTCGPHEKGCGVDNMELTQQRAEERFIFVGLTEEYVRSIRMLEVLLPDWFDGASELLLNIKLKRETSEENTLTGTTMTGCLSKESRRLLTEGAQTRATFGPPPLLPAHTPAPTHAHTLVLTLARAPHHGRSRQSRLARLLRQCAGAVLAALRVPRRLALQRLTLQREDAPKELR